MGQVALLIYVRIRDSGSEMEFIIRSTPIRVDEKSSKSRLASGNGDLASTFSKCANLATRHRADKFMTLVFAEQVTRVRKNPSARVMKSQMHGMTLKATHSLQRV